MTICLNMIVKNESHIIESTLENICTHMPISYWVISDTGSTDDTKYIIQTFFTNKNIPGELVEHEWKDFAYNRTKALECAFDKTDYVFIFDADDSIEGTITLPKLTADKYMFRFGTDFSYERPLLMNNRKKWFYTGVLHEYLDASEPRHNGTIQGKYYIISGRSGARSQNPNKYYDDAMVLKNAYEIEPRKDLKSRYCFYCAQSFLDARHLDEAIEWYKKTIQEKGWTQEIYHACIQLGEIYKAKQDYVNMQMYWSNASIYDKERIEGVVLLMEELYKQNCHVMVNALYHRWKDYSHDLKQKLFVRVYLYEYELEYYNSISAYYLQDFDTGYICCKKVIMHHKNEDKLKQTFNNLLFYKSYLQKDKKFLTLIKDKVDSNLYKLYLR